MNYRECIEYLFSCHARGIKLGLENMKELAKPLKNPQEQLRAIHIAGTNGKGSCSTKIAAALESAGYKVGLYTSPHISSFRERIRINGRCISEQDVLFHMQKISKSEVPGTFFEYTTMLAFDYFATQNVDFCVLETGLGGRLDATNICNPVLAVICSISLDHTQILGNTCEEIALEKAGIIKEGIPLVIGPRVPKLVMEGRCAALKAPLVAVEGCFDDYEEENNAVASAALNVLKEQGVKLLPKDISYGLDTSPPCRFERISKPSFEAVLDVAHNPDGIERLLMRIKQQFGEAPFCVLCGFSKDKDVDSCLEPLVRSSIALFFVEADSPRAMPSDELLAKSKTLDPYKEAFACKAPGEGIKMASSYAATNGMPLIVCGTFFIMAPIRRFLGFDEPYDARFFV